jgi:hypothetical protein
MDISQALIFSLEQARKLRDAVKDDTEVMRMIDEFEETAIRATVIYCTSPERKPKFELASYPLNFSGLMCDTYSLVYSLEVTDEIRDLLVVTLVEVDLVVVGEGVIHIREIESRKRLIREIETGELISRATGDDARDAGRTVLAAVPLAGRLLKWRSLRTYTNLILGLLLCLYQ